MSEIPAYQYSTDECDVHDKAALQQFRDKRAQWLTWLNHDDHHAISPVISSMVWAEVSFRILARAAELEPNGCLSNSLVAEVLIGGHFASQTLAIRRLIDPRNDVISLKRLLDDLGKNIHLFSRENFVAFDGLPYDYDMARSRVWAARPGGDAFWAARTGPDGYCLSESAHRAFDQLSGVATNKRSRSDRISISYVEGLQKWITESDAKNIVDWTHKYLAHAADEISRSLVDTAVVQPNLQKITAVIRTFVRVSEAVQALFLNGHGEVMPVAQFNQFKFLDAPLVTDIHHRELHNLWDRLTAERNGFSQNVLDELLKPPPAS